MDYSTNNWKTTTGQQAVSNAAKAKIEKTYGKATTEGGTLIVPRSEAGGAMDKEAFLKIMVAEFQNMDPTSNQDNTQYVTQMAQLSTMEQMSNLNSTMSAYSYQSLIGKGVTVAVQDLNGDDYTGIVRGVSKVNDNWQLSLEVNENGKNVYKVFDATTLESVLGVADNSSAVTSVNSDFMAASNLSSDKNNKVIILNTDSKGTQSLVKGTVKSAYLDNGVVKIRVATYDADGKESTTTTDYPYGYVVKAGDLTDADMNVTIDNYVTPKTDTSSTDITDPNDPNYDKASAEGKLSNSTTQVKGASQYQTSADDIAKQNKKLQDIING